MGYLQELSRATVASVAILASCSTAVAQVAEAETSQWSQAVWNAAMHGSSDETLDALENIPDGVDHVTLIRTGFSTSVIVEVEVAPPSLTCCFVADPR